jgi:hypothetical protein
MQIGFDCPSSPAVQLKTIAQEQVPQTLALFGQGLAFQEGVKGRYPARFQGDRG